MPSRHDPKQNACEVCSTEILGIVTSIQKKLDESANLSSELDKLNMSIESLETGQNKIIASIQKISDAIYDPDSGLYSRIKDIENSTQNLANEIKINYASDTTDVSNCNKQIEKLTLAVAPVQNLVQWKNRVNNASKWLATTIGVSTIGMLSKFIYDAIVSN